ncbi:hypothetical protein M9458_043385, partial [Cirrhinus mrigala]
MDPFDAISRLEYLLPPAGAGERLLDDYTRLFVALANFTSYPDYVFCSFYDASLNTACRTARFHHLRVDTAKECISVHSLSTCNQEPSPPSDHKPEPAVTNESLRLGVSELRSATEPELRRT